MLERKSDRWFSLIQSVLLHGAILGVLGYGYWVFKHRTPPPAQTLGIEAVALDARAVNSSKKPPVPPPPQPEPQPQPEPEPQEQGPPTPSAEQIAQREQAQRQEEEQRKAEAQRVVEEKKQAEEKRAAEEKERQQVAERDAAEREKRDEAQAKHVAEEKRLADLKRKEEEKKKEDEARMRDQREQELRQSLQEEERVMAARSSGALANWQAQITAKIQRAWLRPASARPGIDCVVYVSQVPGGEVTNVRVGACNGDPAVRESIESAVYRASPLPAPPDPALFERNLEIRFKPVD